VGFTKCKDVVNILFWKTNPLILGKYHGKIFKSKSECLKKCNVWGSGHYIFWNGHHSRKEKMCNKVTSNYTTKYWRGLWKGAMDPWPYVPVSGGWVGILVFICPWGTGKYTYIKNIDCDKACRLQNISTRGEGI
jgi:hypothetical protein